MKYSRYLKKGKKLLNLVREFFRQVIAGSLRRIFTKTKDIEAGAGFRETGPRETLIDFNAASTANTDPAKFNMETGLFCGTEAIGAYLRGKSDQLRPGQRVYGSAGHRYFQGKQLPRYRQFRHGKCGEGPVGPRLEDRGPAGCQEAWPPRRKAKAIGRAADGPDSRSLSSGRMISKT